MPEIISVRKKNQYINYYAQKRSVRTERTSVNPKEQKTASVRTELSICKNIQEHLLEQICDLLEQKGLSVRTERSICEKRWEHLL
jgi:hypothetical protein